MAVDLVVKLDQQWIELPVESEQDSGEWAAGAVEELVARSRRAEGDLALLTQTWAAVLDDLRGRVDGGESRLVTGYGLAPDDDLLPVTVVELHAVGLDDRGVDGLVEDLVAPADGRFGPPEVTAVAAPAGEATRVRQLLVVAGRDDEQSVATSLVYVWSGPEDGTGVLMTAYFASPVDAELCIALVDEVASSLTYQPTT